MHVLLYFGFYAFLRISFDFIKADSKNNSIKEIIAVADIKTHLRELSVATTFGLLNRGIEFNPTDLYDSEIFLSYAKKVISGDITSAENLRAYPIFSKELKKIVDNGFRLGKEIYKNSYFKVNPEAPITWEGNDTQKEDPVDVTIGDYGFSLKEESFILENMGLYKLLNCYTGSNYKKRHIFKDYAKVEYESWFNITWKELLKFLNINGGMWIYNNIPKHKCSKATLSSNIIKLEYFKDDKLVASSSLPVNCNLAIFESKTSSKTRENVFSKFINSELKNNKIYNTYKRNCAIIAANNLATELTDNLDYHAGLPRFLRIHSKEYYYAKTTSADMAIFRVPPISSFGDEIVIDSIKSSVPDKQANILTTIKNKKTNRQLVLRNECRFSHGQFNGIPEAKMYYEHGGSLEVIYDKIYPLND